MESDKLHIAFDMDDVVLAFTEGVMETVNRDYDANLSTEDVVDWYFGKYGLDEVLGRSWWAWMQDHNWLWSEKFKPVPGAVGYVEDLRRQGYYLELITSKPPWAEHHVYAWLGRYFKGPSFQTVTIIDATQSSKYNVAKSQVSDADVLIDDRDKNVMEWVESSESRHAIVFDRPWNRNLVTATDYEFGQYGLASSVPNSRVFRAKNFADVRRIIMDLEEAV